MFNNTGSVYDIWHPGGVLTNILLKMVLENCEFQIKRQRRRVLDCDERVRKENHFSNGLDRKKTRSKN